MGLTSVVVLWSSPVVGEVYRMADDPTNTICSLHYESDLSYTGYDSIEDAVQDLLEIDDDYVAQMKRQYKEAKYVLSRRGIL